MAHGGNTSAPGLRGGLAAISGACSTVCPPGRRCEVVRVPAPKPPSGFSNVRARPPAVKTTLDFRPFCAASRASSKKDLSGRRRTGEAAGEGFGVDASGWSSAGARPGGKFLIEAHG